MSKRRERLPRHCETTVEILGEGEDRTYHIPGVSDGGQYETLCGWVDVNHTIHDATQHPVNCSSCLKILDWCKTHQVYRAARCRRSDGKGDTYDM